MALSVVEALLLLRVLACVEKIGNQLLGNVMSSGIISYLGGRAGKKSRRVVFAFVAELRFSTSE